MAAVHFVHDDPRFLAWLKQHPNGYVLNTNLKPSREYMKLHSALCSEWKREYNSDEPFTGQGYSKVVAKSVRELQQWVMKNGRPDGTFTGDGCRCLRGHNLFIGDSLRPGGGEAWEPDVQEHWNTDFMKLVSNRAEVVRNLLTLEAYRTSPNPSERAFYRDRLRNGTCFLVYDVGDQLLFGPSRFIGYVDNDIAQHNTNDDKDGRETNPLIEGLFGPFQQNNELESLYRRFCAQNAIPLRPAAPFGKPRKYAIHIDKAALDLLVGTEDAVIGSTERQAQIAIRIGQSEFRTGVIELWRSCSVTRCTELDLLTASHIKPWQNSTDAERLDPYNGLLLIPNLDRTFDKGYISFNDSGRIIISKRLSDHARSALGIRRDMELQRVDPRHCPYLAFHREWVFVNGDDA